MTNYRAALAELLDAAGKVPVFKDERAWRSWLDANIRARTLLAAPEAVGVSSAIYLEQVDELCAEHGFHYDGAESLIILRGVIAHAIARYGTAHPAPVPVLVSERLPGEADCDAEGTCWVWNFTAYTWGLFRLDLTAHSHWLPHWALPLPEAQP